MDIDSLRLIILLSRTLNFTKASSESFMTQPTLSRKIVQCEEELGIKIFNRSTHSVSLTEAGREVIDDIQRIVSLYDELSGYCHSLDKKKPLKIGYSVYPYGLSFCMKVEEFLKKNGDNIASSIDFIPLEESVKALANGNIDGLVTIDFLKENETIRLESFEGTPREYNQDEIYSLAIKNAAINFKRWKNKEENIKFFLPERPGLSHRRGCFCQMACLLGPRCV